MYECMPCSHAIDLILLAWHLGWYRCCFIPSSSETFWSAMSKLHHKFYFLKKKGSELHDCNFQKMGSNIYISPFKSVIPSMVASVLGNTSLHASVVVSLQCSIQTWTADANLAHWSCVYHYPLAPDANIHMQPSAWKTQAHVKETKRR